MKWAQLVILGLWAVGLLLAANNHGKRKIGNHSFWVTLTAFAIEATMFYCAGGLSQIVGAP